MNPFFKQSAPISSPRWNECRCRSVPRKAAFSSRGRIAIRLLRGANMEKRDGFYNELGAALQLPLYFGKNWDALDECLADLEWLPADAYLLFFADAPLVLKAAGEKDRDIFFQLLVRTCNEWINGSSLGDRLQRKPKPFHVVLHTGVVEAGQILQEVEAANRRAGIRDHRP